MRIVGGLFAAAVSGITPAAAMSSAVKGPRKTYLVTGSTDGIGQHTATLLAKDGAHTPRSVRSTVGGHQGAHPADVP